MYYEVVGESQNSYARYVFLNELLAGQEVQYIDNLFTREREVPLRFNQQNCYICLLGLSKEVYSGYYGLTTNQYMQIYVSFERRIMNYLQIHGYAGEVFLHLYAGKQIVIIFSKQEGIIVPPMKIAQYAQDSLQEMYEECFLHENVYCNQTYFSEDFVYWEQLADVFKELLNLSTKNYFLMEPRVITKTILQTYQVIPKEADLQEQRLNVIAAINAGDISTCRSMLKELMLHSIKYSFNEYLLQDAVALFKRFYLQCCTAYDIPMEDDLDAMFDYKMYPNIELLTEKLLLIFEKCIAHINAKEKKYNRMTQEALRIIKLSYYKSDISLSYIANQINVSPSYLSSVFNREVGMSIAKYIMELRIEKARNLLKQTSLRIVDVAEAVGYNDKRYFGQVFKRETGSTPNEYRYQ